MSISLVNAFQTMLELQGRKMQLERFGSLAPIDVTVAPSSYARDMAAMEEISITGREFIISKKDLTPEYIPLRKGDILIDDELGENTIAHIREMVIMGQVAGYRVRTK